MQIVIDPSAILAVLLHEPERDSIVAATEGAILVAPASLPWEIGNALVAGLRRNRLRLNDVEMAWASYDRILVRLVEIDMAIALRVAAEHHLYAYDAYILETAKSRRLPLLTLDNALAEAATDAGVSLLEIKS
ncbi:MAG: twitching motility protein PilT [Candidatus Hydrogenedentota bacterium]